MKFTELRNVGITNTLRENNVSYLKETRSLEQDHYPEILFSETKHLLC